MEPLAMALVMESHSSQKSAIVQLCTQPCLEQPEWLGRELGLGGEEGAEGELLQGVLSTGTATRVAVQREMASSNCIELLQQHSVSFSVFL